MLSIKIFIIAWFLGDGIFESYGNRELCEQQAENSFRFLRIGNTERKDKCFDLCCQHKQCQVAIQSGSVCFGIHCARKEVCNLISEQLASFEGHRVDKRSTDDTEDDWVGEADGDIMQESTEHDTVKDEKGDEDNADPDDSDQDNDDDVATCPSSNFHHSYIPKRRHSFLFSNLHSGRLSLAGCTEQCCKINDCVLAFIVTNTCYGVICSGDGGCHTLSDRLPRKSIFVTTVTKVIKNIGADHHHKRRRHHNHPRHAIDEPDDDERDKRENIPHHVSDEPDVTERDEREFIPHHVTDEPNDDERDKKENHSHYSIDEPDDDEREKKENHAHHVIDEPDDDERDKKENHPHHALDEPDDNEKDKKEYHSHHALDEPDDNERDKKEYHPHHALDEPDDTERDKKEYHSHRALDEPGDNERDKKEYHSYHATDEPGDNERDKKEYHSYHATDEPGDHERDKKEYHSHRAIDEQSDNERDKKEYHPHHALAEPDDNERDRKEYHSRHAIDEPGDNERDTRENQSRHAVNEPDDNERYKKENQRHYAIDEHGDDAKYKEENHPYHTNNNEPINDERDKKEENHDEEDKAKFNSRSSTPREAEGHESDSAETHHETSDEPKHRRRRRKDNIAENDDIKGEERDGSQDDSAGGKSIRRRRRHHEKQSYHDNDDEGSSSDNDDGTANKRPKRYEHERHNRKHKKHMKERHFEEEDGDSDEDREEDTYKKRVSTHSHHRSAKHHKSHASGASHSHKLKHKHKKDKKVKKGNRHAKHKHVSHRNARKKNVKKKRKKKKKKFKIKKKKKTHVHNKSKTKHISRHIIMPPDDDGSGERGVATNEDVISGEGNDEDAHSINPYEMLAKRNTIAYPSRHKLKKSHKHHVQKKKGKKAKQTPKEDEMSEDTQIVREIPNNVEMLDFKPKRDDSLGQINDEKMTELPWEKVLNEKESVAKSQVNDEDNGITPISPNETFGDVADSDYGSTDLGDFEIPHTENMAIMPKTPMMDEEGSTVMTIPNIDDTVVHHSEHKHADKSKHKQKHKHTDKHKGKHKNKEQKKKRKKKKKKKAKKKKAKKTKKHNHKDAKSVNKIVDKDKAIMEKISLLDSMTEDVVNKKEELEPDKLLNLVAEVKNAKDDVHEDSKKEKDDMDIFASEEKDNKKDKQEDNILSKMVEELKNLKPIGNDKLTEEKPKSVDFMFTEEPKLHNEKRTKILHVIKERSDDDIESGSGSGLNIDSHFIEDIHKDVKHSHPNTKKSKLKQGSKVHKNIIPTPEKSDKDVGTDLGHKEDIFKEFGQWKSLDNVHSLFDDDKKARDEDEGSGEGIDDLKDLAHKLNISDDDKEHDANSEDSKSMIDIDMGGLTTVIKQTTASTDKNTSKKSKKAQKKTRETKDHPKSHHKSKRVSKTKSKLKKSSAKKPGKKGVVAHSKHQKKSVKSISIISNALTTPQPKITITVKPTQPIETTVVVQHTVPTVAVDGMDAPTHSVTHPVPTVAVDGVSPHPAEHVKKINKNSGHKAKSKKQGRKNSSKTKNHHSKQNEAKHTHKKIPMLNIEIGDEVADVDNPPKPPKVENTFKTSKKKGKSLHQTATLMPVIHPPHANPLPTLSSQENTLSMSSLVMINNHPTHVPIVSTSKLFNLHTTFKPFFNHIYVQTTRKYKLPRVSDPYMIQASSPMLTKAPVFQQEMVQKQSPAKGNSPQYPPGFNQDVWNRLLSYMQPGHTMSELKNLLKPTTKIIKTTTKILKSKQVNLNDPDEIGGDDMPKDPGERKLDHSHDEKKLLKAGQKPIKQNAENELTLTHTHDHKSPELKPHDAGHHKISPDLLNHLIHGKPGENIIPKPQHNANPTQKPKSKHTIKPSVVLNRPLTTHHPRIHLPTHPLAHVAHLALQPSVIKRLPTRHHTTHHLTLKRHTTHHPTLKHQSPHHPTLQRHHTTKKVLIQLPNHHHLLPTKRHPHPKTAKIIQNGHHNIGPGTPKVHRTTRRHTTKHHTTRHHPTNHQMTRRHSTHHHTTHKPRTSQHPRLMKNIFHQPTIHPQLHKTPTKHKLQNQLIFKNKVEHKGDKASPKKETPEEIVNRILNKQKDEDKLDSFFSKTLHEENAGKHSSIGKDKEKPKLNEDKLEMFFRHSEKKKKEQNGVKAGKIDKTHDALSPSNRRERNHDEILHMPGCNVLNDVWGKDFVTRPGYLLKVPGPINSSTCARRCCHHDTCHVAYFKNMVCHLVQCSNRSVCANIVPTHQNTRIVYFNKGKTDGNQHFCDKNFAIGVPWDKTRAGEAAFRDCPRNAFGKAKRLCDKYANWEQPDFSNCVSQEYGDLKEKMKGLGFTTGAKSLIEELDDTTTQTIDNSLIFGGDIVKASDTISGIANFLQRTKAEEIDHKDLKSFTRSVSNLLDDTNKQEWLNLKPKQFGPAKLMISMENIGLYTAERLKRAVEINPVVTHTIIMSVAKIPNTVSKPFVFPNYTIPVVRQWSPRKDSIMIPHSAFNNDGTTMVTASNYKSLGHMLPHRWNTKKAVTFTDGFVVNSNVISCSIRPKPRRIITPPVTVVLHHIKEMNYAESKCVFWDFNAGNTGGWSSEGCWLAKSNRTTTICKCNHLTHFAILSNAYDQKVNAKEQSKEKVMAFVWLGIPLSIMLVVGALYTCFSWSKDPRRRHVVLMDKKPNLPHETTVETPRVSEKFEPSPKRILYASNTKNCPTLPNSPQKSQGQRKWVVSPCKSSKSSHSDHTQNDHNGFTTPSDLEWEHAWDFLANSNFAGSNNKDIYPDLKKKIIGMTVDVYEKPKSTVPGATSKIDKWNYQDDTEWSSDRIKCLSKGSSQTTVDHPDDEDDDDASFLYQSDTQMSESFCPVGISSPQSSLSGREEFNRSETLRHGKNYLRISFDADVDISSGTSSRQSASLQGSDKDLCTEENIEIEEVKQRVTKLVNSLHTECTAYNDAYKSNNGDSVLLNSSKVLADYALSKHEALNTTIDDDNSISLNVTIDDDDLSALNTTIEHDSTYCDIILDDTDENSNDIPFDNNNRPEENVRDKHIFRRSVFNASPYNSPCEKDCCYLGLDTLFQEFEDSLEDIPTTGRLNVTPAIANSICSSLDTAASCDIEELNSTYEWQRRAISNIRSYLCHDDLASSMSSVHDYSLTFIPPESDYQHDSSVNGIDNVLTSVNIDRKHVDFVNTSEDSGYILKDSLHSPIDSLDQSTEDNLVKDLDVESRSSLVDTSTDSFLSEVNVAFEGLQPNDISTSSPTYEHRCFVNVPSPVNRRFIDENHMELNNCMEEDTAATDELQSSPSNDDSEENFHHKPQHINDIKSKNLSKKPKLAAAKKMMNSTAISTSGCRVKRRQKGNKQCHTLANSKAPTRHMKSYIALRMQCRMNETSTTKETETQKKSKVHKLGTKSSPVKTNPSTEKSSPVKTQPALDKPSLVRSHSTVERLSPIKSPSFVIEKSCTNNPSIPLRSCVKKNKSSHGSKTIDTVNENLRQMKESSNKRQQSSSKRRTLRFATEYQIAYSRENIPAKVDQGFKSKERLAKHWNVAKHMPRQLNMYKNPSFVHESCDAALDADGSTESHVLHIEQRAFAGQLRRWECEELASIP